MRADQCSVICISRSFLSNVYGVKSRCIDKIIFEAAWPGQEFEVPAQTEYCMLLTEQFCPLEKK